MTFGSDTVALGTEPKNWVRAPPLAPNPPNVTPRLLYSVVSGPSAGKLEGAITSSKLMKVADSGGGCSWAVAVPTSPVISRTPIDLRTLMSPPFYARDDRRCRDAFSPCSARTDLDQDRNRISRRHRCGISRSVGGQERFRAERGREQRHRAPEVPSRLSGQSPKCPFASYTPPAPCRARRVTSHLRSRVFLIVADPCSMSA